MFWNEAGSVDLEKQSFLKYEEFLSQAYFYYGRGPVLKHGRKKRFNSKKHMTPMWLANQGQKWTHLWCGVQ